MLLKPWRPFLEFHFPVIGIVLGVIWEELLLVDLQIQESSLLKFLYPRDFPGSPVVKTFPFNAGGVAGLIPGRGTKIPHASWPKEPQNIKQKFNTVTSSIKTLKVVHIKKKKNSSKKNPLTPIIHTLSRGRRFPSQSILGSRSEKLPQGFSESCKTLLPCCSVRWLISDQNEYSLKHQLFIALAIGVCPLCVL